MVKDWKQVGPFGNYWETIGNYWKAIGSNWEAIEKLSEYREAIGN